MEGGGVESEGGAAAGVGVCGVREGGEGGAGEVVAVHGDGDGEVGGGVEAGCYQLCEGCFAFSVLVVWCSRLGEGKGVIPEPGIPAIPITAFLSHVHLEGAQGESIRRRWSAGRSSSFERTFVTRRETCSSIVAL